MGSPGSGWSQRNPSIQIESVLPPTLQPAPSVPGGSALTSCRIGQTSALASGDRRWGEDMEEEGNKRETGQLD